MAGRRTLEEVYAEAQRVGTLGDRPIPEVIEHARHFLPALEGVSGIVVDIGTGAGVPGLVIAEARPDLRLVLVDRRATRMDALRRAVSAMGLSDRVEVITGETNQVSTKTELHHRCSAVVSRGFGPPLETAEQARGFLAPGGALVVTEPPEPDPTRWPEGPLASLGYGKPQYLQGIVMFHVEH